MISQFPGGAIGTRIDSAGSRLAKGLDCLLDFLLGHLLGLDKVYGIPAFVDAQMKLGLTYHGAFDFGRARQAFEAGFALERLVEPLPTEEFRQADPEDYEKLSRQPGFLCVRARRGERGAGGAHLAG